MSSPDADPAESSGIGTLNEGSLHAALKDICSQDGDRFEVPLNGFVIDLVRDELLIEVQTGSFGAMGNKLDRLLPEYRIHLVHPIAVGSWLVREGKKTRKSPKKGCVHSLFEELVRLPTLLDHPNLTLEIFLVEQDVHKVEDPKARRGRGGWRTVDRSLRQVVERRVFEETRDLLDLLPNDLPDVFTTADIAKGAGISRSLAQAMAYCFRANELVIDLGRKRDGVHYKLAA